jgi:hypothetical protein
MCILLDTDGVLEENNPSKVSKSNSNLHDLVARVETRYSNWRRFAKINK